MKHLIQFEAIEEPYYGGCSAVLEITAWPLNYKNRASLNGAVLELSLRSLGDELYRVFPTDSKALKAYAEEFSKERNAVIKIAAQEAKWFCTECGKKIKQTDDNYVELHQRGSALAVSRKHYTTIDCELA